MLELKSSYTAGYSTPRSPVKHPAKVFSLPDFGSKKALAQGNSSDVTNCAETSYR